MGQQAGTRLSEVWVATADTELRSKLETAITHHGALTPHFVATGDELTAAVTRDSTVLIDEALSTPSAFALCRQLRSDPGCRVFLLLRSEASVAAPIARFCGAQGALTLSAEGSGEELFDALSEGPDPVPIDRLLRESGEGGEDEIRRGVLRDLESVSRGGVLESITDPETKLFNYEFLIFKLDEEYKRASRFKFPLSCVMLGFEGEASENVLLELAGIFLNESRDTDVLGRFDLNSFLFLLPNTGPDGARAMADRMAVACEERKLKDLTGDALHLSIGISYYPHPEITRREQLYERARAAFLDARNNGRAICVVE